VLYQLSYGPLAAQARLPRCLETTVLSGQGRNRTADTTIFSRVLYQLSYLAKKIRPSRFGAGGHGSDTPLQKLRRGRNPARGDPDFLKVAGAGFEPATFGL
jgi:hypothetical protein